MATPATRSKCAPALRAVVRRLGTALAEAVYPRTCPICGVASPRSDRLICWSCFSAFEPYSEGLCEVCGRFAEGGVEHSYLCGACRARRPAFDCARAACRFDGALRDLLHCFKYQGGVWLRADLADLLDGCARAHFDVEAVDVVVPVPLFAARLRERTYNQSGELAAELATRLDRRFDGTSLRRLRPTATQTRLSAEARRQNVRGAFAVRDNRLIVGRTVMLVDDVMTTGATLDECAATLKKAGARAVLAIAVARGS